VRPHARDVESMARLENGHGKDCAFGYGAADVCHGVVWRRAGYCMWSCRQRRENESGAGLCSYLPRPLFRWPVGIMEYLVITSITEN
jgi:hypothetical protein